MGKPDEFFAYEMTGPAAANPEGVPVADIHEIPDTVKIAEQKPCGMHGCDGELKWNGTQSRSNPVNFPLICQKCGTINLFTQDLAGLVVGAKLVDIVPNNPEPTPEPEVIEPDAPADLVDAAKLLAKQLDQKVFVACKQMGGNAIRLPLPDGGIWCITLEQDMYDGWYCIYPDGKVMQTEQYT